MHLFAVRFIICVSGAFLFALPARSALPPVLDLANLSSENRQRVFLIYGGNGLTDAGEFLGQYPAAYGDINGDAYDDIVLLSLRSRAYVIFGSPALRGQTLNLEPGEFETPTPGQLRIIGQSIGSVAVGDMDRDGYDDILLGAGLVNGGGRDTAGRVHIIYGSPSLPGQFIDLFSGTDSVPLSNETRILGDTPLGAFGSSVFAGDLNADGFDDIIARAGNAATSDLPSREGAIIISGAPNLRGIGLDLSPSTSLTMHLNETRFLAPDTGFSAEFGVSFCAMDMDRDGLNDLFFGAPRNGEIGEAYGFFARAGGATGIIDMATSQGAQSGHLLAAPSLQPTPSPTSGFNTQHETVSSPAGAWGPKPQMGFGSEITVQRGRRVTEIAIAAIQNLFSQGGSRVASNLTVTVDPPALFMAISYPIADVLGRIGPGAILLLDASEGSPGLDIPVGPVAPIGGAFVAGAGTNHLSGTGLAFGDLNGDGLDDLLVGSPGASPSDRSTMAGQVYVIYDGDNLINANIDLATTGSQDVLITGIGENPLDNLGVSVAGDGDMDGDGISDMVIGASGGDNPFTPAGDVNEGYVAVVFGDASVTSVSGIVYSPPGNTPRQGVGGRLSPVLRTWISYEDGAGPGGGASYTAVFAVRSKNLLGGNDLPSSSGLANIFWAVATDRETFTSATIEFQYGDGEISGLNENGLALYHGQTTNGPWSLLSRAQFDFVRNRVSIAVEPRGVFAIGVQRTNAMHWQFFQ